jgi:hypothetical protein
MHITSACWSSAHHLGVLVEMGVHRRHVALQLGNKVGGVRFGGGAHPTGDVLDAASELPVSAKHFHVGTHVHAVRAAEHPRARVAEGRVDNAAQNVTKAKEAGAGAEHG